MRRWRSFLVDKEIESLIKKRHKCDVTIVDVLEQSDASFKVVSPPEWHGVEFVSIAVERHFEVGVGQVLLQVAPVNICNKM